MSKKKSAKAVAGGRARANSLSTNEMKAIAAKGGVERAARLRGLPKETHTGLLKFGSGLECSVLSNGMRVLSASGLGRAFGSGAKANSGRQDDEGRPVLPTVLAAANVRPFVKPELMAKLAKPIEYRGMHGGRVARGYEADILAQVCDVFLDARVAGVLRSSQAHIAAAAELLMRGFAHVGLVALIDEATGYQAERARDELYKILEQYISKELLPWTKKFPDEFFEQVYRVHGWRYQAGNTQRPGYVGTFINKFIYKPLPDGVLEELRRRNPPVNGHRRHRHFQLLTAHTGNPHLDRQIIATTTVLKLADTKDDFKAKFHKAFPKSGDQMEIEFPDDGPDDSGADDLQSNSDGMLEVTGGPRGLTFDFLAKHGASTTVALAKAVYGEDDGATLNKMRKFLARLKAEGLVEATGPGAPFKGVWRIRPGAAPEKVE